MRKSSKIGCLILMMLFTLVGCSSRQVVSPKYEVRFVVEEDSLNFEQGGMTQTLVVLLENRRFEALSSEQEIYLSYHLLDEEGNIIKYDNERSEISTIPARGKGEVELIYKVPMEKGNYYLQLDIVHEGVEWFSDKGNLTYEIPLIIR